MLEWLKTLALAGAILILGTAHNSAAADASLQENKHPGDNCRVVLTIGNFAEPNPNFGIIQNTVQTVKEVFSAEGVCVRQVSTAELEATLTDHKTDLFLASSGLYRRVLNRGVRDIANLMGPHITDPNQAEGAAFIVLKDRTDLVSLKSLRGMRLAANFPFGFSGYLAGLREIADAGWSPDNFFAKTTYVGSDQSLVLNALVEDKADVGIVRACMLEDVVEKDARYAGKFRVIAEQHHPGFACRHSTQLYPSWVFGVTKRLAPDLAARAATAVLNMPPTKDGLYWSMVTDFSEVDRLNRVLKIGPYAFLRTWTLARIWEEYRTWIVALAILVLGLLVHGWRTEKLVERRTKQLEKTLDEERRMEARVAETTARMEKLQKAGVIGQMSSLITHELGQPIGSIRLYAYGLMRELERGDASRERTERTLKALDRSAERAEEILERVRSYAKASTIRRRPIRVEELLDDAVEKFRITSFGRTVPIEVHSGAACTIVGDPLEMELVVNNLLKNATEALRADTTVKSPKIIVESELTDDYVLLRVIDNGTALSARALQRLQEPLDSSKSDGMGLGLSICRSIVERSGGAITFRRATESSGLIAEVRLPVRN